MAENTPKQQTVFATEAELRATPCTNEKWMGFRVTLAGQVRFTYAGGHGTALERVAKSLGGSAVRLGKEPKPDEVYASMMALSPDQLKDLLARIGTNAQPAPTAPPAHKGKGAK
jgi:hypothetical protein